MTKNQYLGIALILALSTTQMAWPAQYEIDSDHTSVNFTIRHLVISKVKGKFSKFSGSFEYDPQKQSSWKTIANIQAESIDTGVKERDKHLRSADFFDVAKHPTITFVSTGVKEFDGNSGKLEGNLTIHGVTKPVVLTLEVGGMATDPWGNKKAAFSASTKINRKDFGLNWNKALEAGGVLVGDDVEIILEVEGQEKSKTAKK
ncbi:MAG: YceI family protein [Bacteriovoracia bacterium]